MVVALILYHKVALDKANREAEALRKDVASLSVAVEVEKRQLNQQKAISTAQYELSLDVQSISKRTKRIVDSVSEEVIESYDPNIW